MKLSDTSAKDWMRGDVQDLASLRFCFMSRESSDMGRKHKK